MSDVYQGFTRTPIGKVLVKNLGLPAPTPLERYTAGDPLVDGTVLVGGRGRLAESLTGLLGTLGITAAEALAEGAKAKGLVFDATGLTSSAELVALRDFFQPVLRSLETCPRVVVLGTPRSSSRAPSGSPSGRWRASPAASARRSAAAAPSSSSTSPRARRRPPPARSGFLLSPKSAYVSGQVVRIGAHGDSTASDVPAVADRLVPLAGKVALVTGASRGIGEQIARVLHRDGATVVGLDVPQAASELQALMKELDGDWLTLDITGKDAPQRIAQHLKDKHGGVDVVVHNAGITKDKKLANMDDARWEAVIAVNLTAPERITRELLDQEVIRARGSIIGVASIAGIAGNVGQTNYAASKAGVIGFVDSLADDLADGITVNAVAPGFIITQMTAAVPFATREVGQRLNAMSQGGLPVDVAETVAWYADPSSSLVNGNVVRVCGQMMLGA